MIDIKIKKLTTQDTGDVTDKVISVMFEYSYTAEGITAKSEGYKTYPKDAPYTTPYADLTEEQVKGWVTSDTELMGVLECSIKLEWNSKKQAASRVDQDVPW